MNNNNDNNENTQKQSQPGIKTKAQDRTAPKTLLELKEMQALQAKRHRMMLKRKYARRDNPYPPAREKSEEEIQVERTLKAKEIKAAEPQITYSQSYYDDTHEYRHVVLPKNLIKYIPHGLLQSHQWIELGVRQSHSWEHYMVYAPEPHILLFRRSKEHRQQKLKAREEAQKENKEKKAENNDNTVAANISDIPPSPRNGLSRTRSLR